MCILLGKLKEKAPSSASAPTSREVALAQAPRAILAYTSLRLIFIAFTLRKGVPITRRAFFLVKNNTKCISSSLHVHFAWEAKGKKGGPITRRAVFLAKNNTQCMLLSLHVHFALDAKGKRTIERISADLAKCCSRLGAAYDSGVHVAAFNFCCFYIMKGGCR